MMIGMEPENLRTKIPNRYFTFDEANQVLIDLRSKFESAILYNRKLHEILSGMVKGSESKDLKIKARRVRAEIEELLRPVRSKGVEVGNLSPGTLDFPALRNGEQVYISWRRGDDMISWWRPMLKPKNHRKLVDPEAVCWEWRN